MLDPPPLRPVALIVVCAVPVHRRYLVARAPPRPAHHSPATRTGTIRCTTGTGSRAVAETMSLCLRLDAVGVALSTSSARSPRPRPARSAPGGDERRSQDPSRPVSL